MPRILKSRHTIKYIAVGMVFCAAYAPFTTFVSASPLASQSIYMRPVAPKYRSFPLIQSFSSQIHWNILAHLTSSDGLNLLRRMLEAEGTLALAGTQVTTISRHGVNVSSQERIIRNGSEGVRIDYFQPAQLAGEVIVDNGSSYWHYIPATKTVEIGPSRMRRYKKRVHQVISQIEHGQMAVSILGLDTIAGRPCRIIEISPNNGTGPLRRFWTDSANGAQLKVEQYRPNGKLQSTTFYTGVTFSPPIGPDTFAAPSTPPGVTTKRLDSPISVSSIAQAQTQVGFTVLQASYIPAGFSFQSAQVGKFHGRKLVILRYNNGVNVLSLFQTPAENGHGNQSTRSPRAGVVTKVQGGQRIILVGNLAMDEMTRVLDSLR